MLVLVGTVRMTDRFVGEMMQQRNKYQVIVSKEAAQMLVTHKSTDGIRGGFWKKECSKVR